MFAFVLLCIFFFFFPFLQQGAELVPGLVGPGLGRPGAAELVRLSLGVTLGGASPTVWEFSLCSHLTPRPPLRRLGQRVAGVFAQLRGVGRAAAGQQVAGGHGLTLEPGAETLAG